MTLAVVSASFQPPLQAKSVEDTDPPATDPQKHGLDFASILLGLPVIATGPLPEDDKPANHEKVIDDAGTVTAAADPQFLATLGYLPSPDRSEVASNPEIAPSLPIRSEAPLPSRFSGLGPDTLEIRAKSSNDRQQLASTLLAADDKPAKFAVSQSTIPSTKQSGTNTPQLRDPASNPGTLTAMPSPAQAGTNTFELRDPASNPGTLAAMPSPAQVGTNTFELRDPASNPGTLAAMPSPAQAGTNTFELRDPASNPGTLAAMPSPTQSGSNTFALRDPASNPGTLAAMASPTQSGTKTFELRDPASQPNTLSTIPFPEPGSNTTELRDPASSLSTLAAVPGNAVSGATVTDGTTDHLRTPLRDPSWAGDLGQKLLWFASNEKQLAQLTLHPPQLGSIEITLNLDKDAATAHFVSPHADVRGAIETAVPRLREMFAGTGIELGQVSIGSESFRQQPDGQRESSHRPRPQADNAILDSDSANGLLSGKSFVAQRGRGLIDIFA